MLNLNEDTISIRQGEGLSKSYGLDDGSVLTGWTCRLQLRDYSGNLVNSVDKVVTTTNTENTQFLTSLLPTETETLEEGFYVLAAELANTSLNASGEIVEKLEVKKQWVY